MPFERWFPLQDGLKPGQRKIMFVCFTKNLIREIKVAQLAGKVAENSAYHHGEQSLTNTIVGLAQTFVGSNNINFLVPDGQFGTRLHGGNDAASARYIFTRLSPLALSLFSKNDEPLLSYLNEDGMMIEPEWYCPVIPTVLVNGAHGVGTGYSTDIPSYNPLTLSNNMRFYIQQERERQHLSNGESKKSSVTFTLKELVPWFKNFGGEISLLENDRTRGVINGICAKLDETSIEITDLPVGVWTQQYKENVLEAMLHPKRNDIPPSILDYKGLFLPEASAHFISPSRISHRYDRSFRDKILPGPICHFQERWSAQKLRSAKHFQTDQHGSLRSQRYSPSVQNARGDLRRILHGSFENVRQA